MTRRHVKWITAVVLVFALCRSAGAVEEYKRFLRGLQERGYGDMAILYLKQIESRPDLPKDLKETIDLELANSLWSAATSAYNDEEAQMMRAEAQTRLYKFMKEKPQHPAVGEAMSLWGSFSYDRGLRGVQAARLSKNQEDREKLLSEARDALADARPKLVKSEESFKAQYQLKKQSVTVPKTKPAPEKKTAKPAQKSTPRVQLRTPELEELAKLEEQWLIAKGKLGLLDYWTAQTYDPDGNEQENKSKSSVSSKKKSAPKSASSGPRIAALKSAAKIFDEIYQQFRTQRAGMMGHLWHAKTLYELGETDLSLDLCDEILANTPEPVKGRVVQELDPILVEAELLHLKLLAKKDQLDEAVKEATAWLKAFAGISATSGYQGVALELAKMQMAQIESLPAAKRRSAQQLVVKLLTDVAKVRSEYQQEAILLRRGLMASSGKGSPDGADATSHDEAVALANAAADNEQWAEALALFEKALVLLEKDKSTLKVKAKKADDVKERMAVVQYRIARANYDAGKMDDAYVGAEKVAREHAKAAIAPAASSVAVYAALRLFSDARKDEKAKGPALERLSKIAEYTLTTWPDKAEADDARIALAWAKIEQGEFDTAIDAFMKVNEKSPKYPSALLYAGQESWRRYRLEKAKPAAERDTKGMATWRSNAEKWLAKSIEGQKTAAGIGRKPPAQLAETQLMLAEIYMEGGRAAEAVKLYEPLVVATIAAKPKELDATTLRIFGGATRVYVAAGIADKAADTAIALAQVAGDNPSANAVLLDATKALMRELQKAEADEITASGDGDKAGATAAAARVAKAKSTLAKLIEPLVARQQLSLATQVYLGEASLRAGKKDFAQALFQRVLKKAEDDAEFRKTTATALTRVRAQLVGMLREENKFDEAMREIDKLIEGNPKSLDLLMQRGRILQSWSKADPAHYPEAVSHWTKLRSMLARMKTKPPEYYEVIYNAAECLIYESEQTKEDLKAAQAEQLLRSTLVLSPRLSGPEMVARYQVLLKRATAAQQRKAAG